MLMIPRNWTFTGLTKKSLTFPIYGKQILIYSPINISTKIITVTAVLRCIQHFILHIKSIKFTRFRAPFPLDPHQDFAQNTLRTFTDKQNRTLTPHLIFGSEFLINSSMQLRWQRKWNSFLDFSWMENHQGWQDLVLEKCQQWNSMSCIQKDCF